MKNVQKLTALLVMLACGVFMVACSCSGPQTSDTSAVAGKYYQHVGDIESGAQIAEKCLQLNADGTWETGAGDTKVTHTFTLDGEDISIFFGSAKMMYGTLADGKLDLTVYTGVEWEEAIFFLESDETDAE